MNAAVHAFPRQPAPNPDELRSEPEILTLRPYVSIAELRAARNAKTITWTRGKRGQPWYRLSDVDAYVATNKEQRCRVPEKAPSSNSGDTGSPPSRAGDACTISGLTRELEEHAADRLARLI